MYVGVENKS